MGKLCERNPVLSVQDRSTEDVLWHQPGLGRSGKEGKEAKEEAGGEHFFKTLLSSCCAPGLVRLVLAKRHEGKQRALEANRANCKLHEASSTKFSKCSNKLVSRLLMC